MGFIFQENFFCCYAVLTDQTPLLISFASWDIWRYVYCNCLFPRLWCHKFWNQHYLSNQAVFLYDQKFKIKISISWERKEPLKVKWKVFFIIFKRLSVAKNCLRPETNPLIVAIVTLYLIYSYYTWFLVLFLLFSLLIFCISKTMIKRRMKQNIRITLKWLLAWHRIQGTEGISKHQYKDLR